jgi:hypothetical protein
VSAGSRFSNLSGPLLAIVGSLNNVWRSAPLAPAAIAFTVGATADRLLAPQPWMVALALLAVTTSACFHTAGRSLWLLILVALVGAGRNGAAGSWTMENDLASLLGDDPIPRPLFWKDQTLPLLEKPIPCGHRPFRPVTKRLWLLKRSGWRVNQNLLRAPCTYRVLVRLL